MLYYLAIWLESTLNPPGIGVFKYITFRSAAAAITSLLICFVFSPMIIKALKKHQIGEQSKQELQQIGNHNSKAGTPTMGGLIVLLATIVPTILWAQLDNWFIIIILIITLWLGLVGFIDDYLKVIKKLPKGLIGRYKMIGQIVIGLFVGIIIYFSPELFSGRFVQFATLTTIPFEKNLNFNWGWFYIPMVIFIITATSNAVNLTDGLDGLSIGTVAISVFTMALIAYFTGNNTFSHYLNIMYLPGSGELTVFAVALVGAAAGFLWFNAYPAQIFLGDTGSLALGGALGGLSILLKKEFLLPIVGGIFLMEALSVILQVSYFKYTKKRYGEGKRLFLIAPIHHHFEKKGWAEPKIVTRFYIIAIILAIITMTTFKVR